jgi:hypothetical protein
MFSMRTIMAGRGRFRQPVAGGRRNWEAVRMGKSMYRRAAAIVVAVAAASALSGCFAPPSFTETVEVAEPTPVVTTEVSISVSPTPQETCAQLTDISTLLHNQAVAFAEQRVSQLEWDGQRQLVSRLVQRIDTSAGSDLADAVDGMKSVVGVSRPGVPTTVDPASAAWNTAFDEAKAECAQAGVEVYSEGWTGG